MQAHLQAPRISEKTKAYKRACLPKRTDKNTMQQKWKRVKREKQTTKR
jgi:hypothetical protein